MLCVATIFASMGNPYPSGGLAFFEKSGGQIEWGDTAQYLLVVAILSSKKADKAALSPYEEKADKL